MSPSRTVPARGCRSPLEYIEAFHGCVLDTQHRNISYPRTSPSQDAIATQLLSQTSDCEISILRYNSDGSRLCAVSKHSNGIYPWNVANRNELVRLTLDQTVRRHLTLRPASPLLQLQRLLPFHVHSNH